MKPDPHALSSSVMEAWIDNTLKAAESLDIPGIILRPTHKNPMKRYMIDKIYLHAQGMSLQDIERIYRAMFVYSVGFYEMI